MKYKIRTFDLPQFLEHRTHNAESIHLVPQFRIEDIVKCV